MFLTVKTSNSFIDILQMDYSELTVMTLRIQDKLTPKETPKQETPELPAVSYEKFYGIENG